MNQNLWFKWFESEPLNAENTFRKERIIKATTTSHHTNIEGKPLVLINFYSQQVVSIIQWLVNF